MTPALAGVLVGGAGKRMGGLAKGLLRTANGATIVERWRGVLERRGLGVVLVGAADGYAHLGIEMLADEPAGIGPLGGLVALLRRAGGRPVLAVACDMPFVSEGLVERLVASSPDAPILAPRRHGRWEPLFARYDPARVLALAVSRARSGKHSLQGLLDESAAVELRLARPEEGELHDWDAPSDISSESAV